MSGLKKRMRWLPRPSDEDYKAALDYLVLAASDCEAMVRQLKRGAVREYKAKDIIRAASISLVADDVDDVRELAGVPAKIKARQRLSPILMIQGKIDDNVPLTIVDGYHRVVALYLIHEDTLVRGVLIRARAV